MVGVTRVREKGDLAFRCFNQCRCAGDLTLRIALQLSLRRRGDFLETYFFHLMFRNCAGVFWARFTTTSLADTAEYRGVVRGLPGLLPTARRIRASRFCGR